MIRAVYARLTVVGTTFVEAQLTPAAYRHGLAVALPEAVQAEWRARPDSPRVSSRIRIPIVKRRTRLASRPAVRVTHRFAVAWASEIARQQHVMAGIRTFNLLIQSQGMSGAHS